MATPHVRYRMAKELRKRVKAPSESKVAPYDSPVNSTLLRYDITEMWGITSASYTDMDMIQSRIMS